MTPVQRILAACLAFFFMLSVPTLGAAEPEELTELTMQFLELLDSGQAEEMRAMLSPRMLEAMGPDLEQFPAQWKDQMGDLLDTGHWMYEENGQYQILEMEGFFSGGNFILRFVFDENLLLSGFFARPGQLYTDTDYVFPDNIVEIPVTVDAGQGFPLSGLLTRPKDGPILAAVVLLHGSGPNDMDETVGSNKPFRDIAHQLASQGIACLRYNKRTFNAAPELVMSADFAKFGLAEEVYFDALAAVNLLKHTDGVDPDRVFLLGHSMTGGLLAQINSLGADCRGYVVLAGSSRPLWELMAEQNLLLAQEMEIAGDMEAAAQIRAMVTQELGKARLLAGMSDAEALQPDNLVFGVSSWYLRDFARIDPAALHLADQKPVLIVHAENDRQVTEVDFSLWQHKLAGHNNAFFAEFDGLNHLFGAYQGPEVPFAQMVAVEYAERTPVPVEVTDFIADWIIANSR